MIWIIVGTLIIAAFLAAAIWSVACVTGWKVSLQIWAFSALVTAIVTGAALLIGYGVDHL